MLGDLLNNLDAICVLSTSDAKQLKILTRKIVRINDSLFSIAGVVVHHEAKVIESKVGVTHFILCYNDICFYYFVFLIHYFDIKIQLVY